ncbi:MULTISPECIES: ORF6N domain-containing protein [Olivibacter]|uniref:ORF6N domain-containing protein n=1 Tax=Olivibacter jilunii TaxID=985016 RepID=A0ABW6B643_9SPHI
MTKTQSSKESLIIPEEVVMNQIYYIRDQKVMLDRDLADLYGVETKVLKQVRNIDKFSENHRLKKKKLRKEGEYVY